MVERKGIGSAKGKDSRFVPYSDESCEIVQFQHMSRLIMTVSNAMHDYPNRTFLSDADNYEAMPSRFEALALMFL